MTKKFDLKNIGMVVGGVVLAGIGAFKALHSGKDNEIDCNEEFDSKEEVEETPEETTDDAE